MMNTTEGGFLALDLILATESLMFLHSRTNSGGQPDTIVQPHKHKFQEANGFHRLRACTSSLEIRLYQ